MDLYSSFVKLLLNDVGCRDDPHLPAPQLP